MLLTKSRMASTQTVGLKRPHPDDDLDNVQKKSKVDINKILADARAKAAAVAARLQDAKGVAKDSSAGSPAPDPTPPPSSILQDRIAQMKARVAAATKAAQHRPTSSTVPIYQPTAYDDGASRARGGLDVGLHPALMGESGQDSRSTKGRQAIQPKFATTMANRRTESPLSSQPQKKQLDLSGPSVEETKSNPYFDPSLGAKTAMAKGRISRQLMMNQKGKYIQQAAALRRQAALEAMKKRIADSSRKAGMIDDLESEKVFLVPAPPDLEWWDEVIVNGTDYSNIESPTGLKVDTPDSVITVYIQHPVPLEPPQEKKMPAPKPMFLTPKEQAKLRRQRRMADLKEQQAKVRLGLEPAPPPKVKKSNLMRVLGEEAVKDPTAVEARVNREIADRFQKHMDTNEARRLTKDQKHEKLATQQASDAARGIHAAVFKIDSLANGRHRFKISKNAEQNALTGICILHPKFCLVIVEGGQVSMKFYKKLMLNRIDWTENSGSNQAREGNQEALASWLSAEDEKGNIKDLSLNTCTLIWEGEQKSRAFRKWGSKVCETDKEAKDALSRQKMDSFWTLAKNQGGS